MKRYRPYFKTKRGKALCGDAYDTMRDALDKYEEWAKDYHISSAWIVVSDTEMPHWQRQVKVKLVGVLKKEAGEDVK